MSYIFNNHWRSDFVTYFTQIGNTHSLSHLPTIKIYALHINSFSQKKEVRFTKYNFQKKFENKTGECISIELKPLRQDITIEVHKKRKTLDKTTELNFKNHNRYLAGNKTPKNSKHASYEIYEDRKLKSSYKADQLFFGNGHYKRNVSPRNVKIVGN